MKQNSSKLIDKNTKKHSVSSETAQMKQGCCNIPVDVFFVGNCVYNRFIWKINNSSHSSLSLINSETSTLNVASKKGILLNPAILYKKVHLKAVFRGCKMNCNTEAVENISCST